MTDNSTTGPSPSAHDAEMKAHALLVRATKNERSPREDASKHSRPTPKPRNMGAPSNEQGVALDQLRGISHKGVPAKRGNPGKIVANESIQGIRYARYRAEEGTWVSASLAEQGYDKKYGKDVAYGAKAGVALGLDGKPLRNPDKIRPGDEYLIPIGTDVQFDDYEVVVERSTLNKRSTETTLLNNRLGNYPFTPPFGRIDPNKNLPKMPHFDSSWILEPEPPPNQQSIRGMVLEAWWLLRDSPEVRKWFKDNWSKDPFKSDITIAYTGKYGTDPFDALALLHPSGVSVYTNLYTGTITFTPRFKGPSAGREIAAGLMHELNNWAAGSRKFDDYSPKGSYTAEKLAYDAYDLAHPNRKQNTPPAATP